MNLRNGDKKMTVGADIRTRTHDRNGNAKELRLNVVLQGKSVERFEYLREEMGGTKTDVIRTSLQLLEAVIKEQNEGKEFFVRDTKTGRSIKYQFFLY